VYGAQKELLEHLNRMTLAPVFVATFDVVEKRDGGLFSYAIWPNGTEAWLPKTEWVVFCRTREDVPAAVKWEKVERIVGHLMTPTEHCPARFHVRAFPSDPDLSALGKDQP